MKAKCGHFVTGNTPTRLAGCPECKRCENCCECAKEYPTVEICSKCGENTAFEWTELEGWTSVCCTRPAWAPDALAESHDA